MTTPDHRSRSQALLDRLYKRAEVLLDRLETKPFATLISAGRGEQVTAELQFVPPTEERDLSQAIANYLRQAQEIEKTTTDPALSAAESMLGRLGQSFGILNADGTPTSPDTPLGRTNHGEAAEEDGDAT